jgi:hypothetical protein
MLTLGYSRERSAAKRRAAVTRPVTFLRLIPGTEQTCRRVEF